MKALLSLLAMLLLATTALAIDAEEPFEDPELQARYDQLIEEIRCLKCQNATIKDSPAFLATDLRREIRRMLLEGATNDQILFLVLAAEIWRRVVQALTGAILWLMAEAEFLAIVLVLVSDLRGLLGYLGLTLSLSAALTVSSPEESLRALVEPLLQVARDGSAAAAKAKAGAEAAA